MECNLQKLWITMLYTCNLHNIVHQLYINFFKNLFLYIYLFFCLDDLSIVESRILNSLAITVLLSIFPFSLIQSLSPVRLLATPWVTACQASLSIINSQSPPKAMSIESVMPSNHLILCRPLLLLPSIFPSIRVFPNESALRIRWPKYWSFSFNISPSNEHAGLISFRMDWLDLLTVWGTLKSLLQHHSLKASILLCSAFFIDQLSHPYMTTGKAIALTRRTFVVKVMSLVFNMLYAAAAAAKSVQSCLTLCDPTDGSPPGSPVSGIL